MTSSMLAITNGLLVLLTAAALTLVTRLALRLHHTTNEESLVPAAPTPLDLHDDELARAA